MIPLANTDVGDPGGLFLFALMIIGFVALLVWLIQAPPKD